MKWSVLPLLLSTLALAACGPADRGNGNGADSNGSGSGSGSGNQDGCSDSAKLVYVVDENNKLSQFDPTTKMFHDLGTLACPAMSGATPFSMGVDRTATAYVLYSSSEVFKVDTSTLMCTKTSYAVQLGLQQFGMGFSTDTAGGDTDHLFIAGGSSTSIGQNSKLATLDPGSMMATSVGNVTGWPELTGNGNAELWGFFPSDQLGTTTPRVEEINKASGAPVAGKTYMQPSLQGMPAAWAFAFYGGDYWIFLMKDQETSTTVYQMNGMSGTITGMTPAPGRTIVGAGVSTCAPVVIE